MSSERSILLASTLHSLGGILGLLQDNPGAFLQSGKTGAGLENEQVQHLIEERALAKQQKDYARADSLRDQLVSQGIILEDTPKGTLWRRD